jgi:hypothetical protein
MKFRIEYKDGKVRECDVASLEAACKYANAFGGLVVKVEKLNSEIPTDAAPVDRMLQLKCPNVRKKG